MPPTPSAEPTVDEAGVSRLTLSVEYASALGYLPVSCTEYGWSFVLRCWDARLGSICCISLACVLTSEFCRATCCTDSPSERLLTRKKQQTRVEGTC